MRDFNLAYFQPDPPPPPRPQLIGTKSLGALQQTERYGRFCSPVKRPIPRAQYNVLFLTFSPLENLWVPGCCGHLIRLTAQLSREKKSAPLPQQKMTKTITISGNITGTRVSVGANKGLAGNLKVSPRELEPVKKIKEKTFHSQKLFRRKGLFLPSPRLDRKRTRSWGVCSLNHPHQGCVGQTACAPLSWRTWKTSYVFLRI